MTELLVVDPVMGEQLDLATASPGRLGQLLLDVREHESRLRELKQLVAEEVARRCDRAREWTIHCDGGMKLSIPSDAPVAVWDADALQEVLDELVADGTITPDAANRAVQPRIELKVIAAGVNALLKSPAIAGRIEECRTLVAPEGRRVSVGRD
jgi:hypothetical protein